MQKVISLILILALICMSSVSVFAEGSAENDDSAYGPRGSSTKYFYDNTGNRYKVVGKTIAAGRTGYARTSGSVKSYAGGDPANFTGITVYGSQDAIVYFQDAYVTPNTYALDDSFSFISPLTNNECVKEFGFTEIVSNVTCTHGMSTSNGGSISFITIALTP